MSDPVYREVNERYIGPKTTREGEVPNSRMTYESRSVVSRMW
jgi:hypothetical protein